MKSKDTLFHIDWGDGDTSFVVAPDEETAKSRMVEGKDMVNHIVSLDKLYQMIHKEGMQEVVEWIGANSYGFDKGDGVMLRKMIDDDWQSFLKEKGLEG